MPEQIKRHIAFKLKIKDLLSGEYIKEEGEWAPNYVKLNDKKVSRVNLLGVIVSITQDQNYKSIILDDGSDKISVRAFNDNATINNSNVGDVVLIIGRPREFGNERYIAPEIIKKIENKAWIELRKLELGENKPETIIEKKIEEIKTETIEEIRPIETKDSSSQIMELIKLNDKGDGADTQEIINSCKAEDSEKIIQNLLEIGEIFEIKPGKIKILE